MNAWVTAANTHDSSHNNADLGHVSHLTWRTPSTYVTDRLALQHLLQHYLQELSVSVRVSIAALKHHDQEARCGGKSLLGLVTLQHCRSSLKKVRTEIQSSQDHENRSWWRDQKENLHACLPPIHNLLSPPSYRTQDGQPGMVPPTIHWALPHWSLNEKMPYSWISWRHFLNWGSVLSDDSNLCQVDTQNQPAHWVTEVA